MKKGEQKRCIFVKVKGEVRRVYVNDLKAIIMRKKPTNRPRVPAFDSPAKYVLDQSQQSISQQPMIMGITA